MCRLSIQLLAVIALLSCAQAVHAADPLPKSAKAEIAKQGERYDKATLHGTVWLSPGGDSRINFAKGACSRLVRKEVAGWNPLSACKVMSILNRPTHGSLIEAEPGIYIYSPKKLGKEVIRFSVENTEGKKAIVTLRVDVVTPQGSINGDNRMQMANAAWVEKPILVVITR